MISAQSLAHRWNTLLAQLQEIGRCHRLRHQIALRFINTEAASSNKPTFVIALTAQVRGADADAWATAGAERHMTKPFTSARLTDALKSAGSGSGLKPAPVIKPSEAAPELPTRTPLIDGEAVATMEAVEARSGRDVVGKVLKLFLSQTPDALFKLETMGAGSNPTAITKQAHFLKSMALSSGAARLAAVCENIEHEGKTGHMTEACARRAKARPLLEETCNVMNALLASRPAAAAR